MRYKSCSTLLVYALMLACSSHTQVPVSTIAQSQHCPVKSPGLSVFRSNEELQKNLQTGAGPLKQRLHSQELENAPFVAEQSWLMVVHMGQQASAGYALSLAADNAEVADGTLTLSLQYHRPQADSMQAAVITTPCIMLSVKKEDVAALKVSKVVAKAGDQRWQHTLKP